MHRTSTRHRTGTVVRSLVASMLAFVAVGCGPLAAGLDDTSAGTGAAPPSTTPLVGAWVTQVTRDDLRAAGITAEGMLDENSGRFTTTFSPDGTWRQVQESLDGAAIAMPVFEGTYEVDGNQFVQVTTTPEAYAGDRLEFTWRIDDGLLSLDLANPPDQIQPVITGAHPWARTTP